jgi:hypothetical protein
VIYGQVDDEASDIRSEVLGSVVNSIQGGKHFRLLPGKLAQLDALFPGLVSDQPLDRVS